MRLVMKAAHRSEVTAARPSVKRCLTGMPGSTLCSASVKRVDAFPWRFDLGRVCEFAGACKKGAQLRARCCRDRARERPTQLSLACVHERHVDCVGAKGLGLGATTGNIR